MNFSGKFVEGLREAWNVNSCAMLVLHGLIVYLRKKGGKRPASLTFKKNEKRYADLAFENLRNFQCMTREGIVVLTHMRGLLFPYPSYKVFSGPSNKDVALQFHA